MPAEHKVSPCPELALQRCPGDPVGVLVGAEAQSFGSVQGCCWVLEEGGTSESEQVLGRFPAGSEGCSQAWRRW